MNNVEKSYTVSQLNASLKMYLKDFSKEGVWIKGEILSYKADQNRRYASFTLCEKEEGSDEIIAQVPAMCWGSELSDIIYKLRGVDRALELKDGLFAQFKCTVDFWPKAGRLQIIVKDIDPSVTIGELHMLRMKIFNVIKELGIHEKNKLLEIPLCPLRIAMISSKGGAGYHDFLSEIKNSGYPFKVDFYHAAVQGADTEKEVVAAIKTISKNSDRYDVLVLIRGGGSIADLKWFDNKNICLAIANCKLPVLTGIGHEINLSAADMIANMNFKTPTAVAVSLVNKVSDFKTALDEMITGVHSKAKDIISENKQFLRDVLKDLASDAQLSMEKEAITLRSLSGNIKLASSQILKEASGKIDGFGEKVRIYDPVNTLKLGFSITRGKNGRVIKNIDQVSAGDDMVTCLAGGRIFSNVNKKEDL
ncbi:MAG: exodeoxyribonuclease VII large subunit [Candidatus Margulisiibacteriota bacterium]